MVHQPSPRLFQVRDQSLKVRDDLVVVLSSATPPGHGVLDFTLHGVAGARQYAPYLSGDMAVVNHHVLGVPWVEGDEAQGAHATLLLRLPHLPGVHVTAR